MFTRSWSGCQRSELTSQRPPRFPNVPTTAKFSKFCDNFTKNPYHDKSKNTFRTFYRTHFIQKPSKVEKVDEENDVQILEEKPDINNLNSSATTKALSRLETDEKKPKPKSGKISNRLRRQKINERLVKLLTPKNAINVLHEIKPNCTYTTKELPNQGCFAGFLVEVKDGDDVLGTGQGTTKCLAKSLAAENGIKTLFSRAMKTISEPNQGNANDEDNWSVFPWAGLAQLAIYKMFNEWQLQGPDYPSSDIQKLMNLAKAPKVTANVTQTKKEIPENAHSLHPTTLLFQIHPHMNFIELERTLGPPSRVKVAFEFGGQQFCGVSTNRKEAKKEAAKLLLSTVYGVKYDS